MITCNKCKQQFVSYPAYRRHVCHGDMVDAVSTDDSLEQYEFDEQYDYPISDIDNGIVDDSDREFMA